MADATMCLSTTCQARHDCRRNPACQEALPTSIGESQPYAYWHPEAGYSCPGFWDARELRHA